MGSDVSHFNVPLIVRPDKVRRRCPQTTGFELKRKESGRSGFERRHPSYQPNSSPLGQTGSQMPAGQARRFWQLCMLGHKTFAQSTTTKQRERERERQTDRQTERLKGQRPGKQTMHSIRQISQEKFYSVFTGWNWKTYKDACKCQKQLNGSSLQAKNIW